MLRNKIYTGDCLTLLQHIPPDSIDCCVTSPPYFGLRDYGNEQQIGLEKTPDEYIKKLVEVFAKVKRVLKPEGTLWLNLGDSYSGSGSPGSWTANKQTEAFSVKYPNRKVTGLKPKDLIGIPWMAAFALRQDGWYLRQDCIWHKPNPMPESVKDRCTKAHEYIFLLSKSSKYYYNYEAMLEEATGYDGRKATLMKGAKKYKDSGHTLAERGHERWRYKNLQEKGQSQHTLHNKRAEGEEYLSPVRNKRSVWSISTKPFAGAHFATFPEELALQCLTAGCPPEGTVIDPFSGAGTVAVVAKKTGRQYIGLELNPEYVEIANKRLDFPVQRRLLQ